ncbi:hypothetical protein P171DRAFT_64253 [Karstenula rhodostoma CBS 690.94]|uniref:Uncharacterized protein n=1 Tax=Karstenula rhodostoma CBS 690.94 TaxID=1392251 RepID=A0A9P4PG13_9PLEO|nr:hypothetical protein P171DRAFT_64253 [Karstenula rhodostoma CBS 690.94]
MPCAPGGRLTCISNWCRRVLRWSSASLLPFTPFVMPYNSKGISSFICPTASGDGTTLHLIGPSAMYNATMPVSTLFSLITLQLAEAGDFHPILPLLAAKVPRYTNRRSCIHCIGNERPRRIILMNTQSSAEVMTDKAGPKIVGQCFTSCESF